MSINTRPQVLILSGLDPSGGAGIQADIQAVTALGAHPLPVVTCLTVQNTSDVLRASPIDAQLIAEQLRCLDADTPFQAVKTGALGSAEVVSVLAEFLRAHPGLPVIVDPVIKAAGGGELADEALLERMRAELFPLAETITPNGEELVALGDGDGYAEPGQAAARLLDDGCGSVLATGGHEAGTRIRNRLYRPGQAVTEWQIPRIGGEEHYEYHGSGCTLAASIAAGRAAGLDLDAAIEQAQTYVSATISEALTVGHGQKVPNRGVRWPVRD